MAEIVYGYIDVLADLKQRRNEINRTILAIRRALFGVSPLPNSLSVRGNWVAVRESEGMEIIVAYGNTFDEVYALIDHRWPDAEIREVRGMV